MKLARATLRLRKFKETRNRNRNNCLFNKSNKLYYTSLRSTANVVSDPPPQQDVSKFWSKLFTRTAKHNEDAAWLKVEEENTQHIQQQQWKDITLEELRKTIKRLTNWKSPGIDQIQNYWYKHLVDLHEILLDAINHVVKNPSDLPSWFTCGLTTLIYKNKGLERDAKNYRPITCLPTAYKLVTLLFTDRVYQHLVDQKILPPEQKGIKRKARGCKDHLLLDKVILERTHGNKRNLGVAWIDYQKAYGSIPHSWIVRVLKLYKVDPVIITFLETTIKLWRTRLVLHHATGSIETGEIYITCGIFQGDSFSPLIFCVALFPLSHILNRAKLGFRLKKNRISHLLYIDDLKIYTANEEELQRALQIVEEFSNDINMSFGLDKCAILVIKNGSISTTNIYPDTPKLDDDENKAYRYLGILEGLDFHVEKVKKATKAEYISRVRKILKSDIDGDKTMTAICAFAMPVLRYTASTYTDPMEEEDSPAVRMYTTVNALHSPDMFSTALTISPESSWKHPPQCRSS
mmetsp:Transcript_36211/g.53028  ORF Transcript_36211/g.53028 Transcript_36211/m.53028 type:complete len:519 (-) Transcript_36211:412-1968(-)